MDESNSKKYQKALGFSNKSKLKAFFDSKDIVRKIDYDYLNLLNKHLEKIVYAIHEVVANEIKNDDINTFIKENIYDVFNYMDGNGLLLHFQNNKQRQLERSYYDWSRGRIAANYFKKALAIIFQVDESDINSIGMDNLDNPKTFSKSAIADFEITTDEKKKYRIEFQCGFQGINDIKEHKVIEARKVLSDTGIHSLIIHIDLFNGCAAFVDISNINDKDINWETRTQFEGKKVFNISNEYFVWNISQSPLSINKIY